MAHHETAQRNEIDVAAGRRGKKRVDWREGKVCTGTKTRLKATISSSTTIWFLRKLGLQTARSGGNIQKFFVFFFHNRKTLKTFRVWVQASWKHKKAGGYLNPTDISQIFRDESDPTARACALLVSPRAQPWIITQSEGRPQASFNCSERLS